MKKLLLTGLALSVATIMNAQGIKASAPGYAWDDFSSPTEFSETGSTYGIFFYKDSLNTAATYKKGGIEYTDGKISQVKTRLGNGLLNYTITQPYNAFIPTGITFGTGNSIDISENPIVTLKLTNQSDSSLYFRVALKDANGNVVDSKGLLAARRPIWYMDEVGFVVSPTNDFSYNGGASTDIKDAVQGIKDEDSVSVVIDFSGAYSTNYVTDIADSISFDFTQVAEVQFTVVNPNQVEADDYNRNALNDISYALSFVGIGDISSVINGLDKVINVSSNETVTAYDMLGNLVGTGKINDLALENGRVYIIKSSSETKKIVMVK